MKTQTRVRHGPKLALAVVAAGFILLPRIGVAGNWNAKNASELLTAINAANQVGGANLITLAPNKTFTLSVVNNTTDGPSGLPVIAANNQLTIHGNGATIARSTAAGTPAFRFFNVASGAVLSLENLTLANGLVVGETGQDTYGGAILASADSTLNVKCSIVVSNQVVGGDGDGGLGGQGFGGAIRTDGIATLENVVFRGNQATGGATTSPEGEFGGLAFGGAASSGNDGSLSVKNCWFTGNRVIGGFRHYPNPLYTASGGGALDIWGTALITDSVFTHNQALGGAADPGVEAGYGIGGALSIGVVYSLNSACTIRHCTFSHNQAIGADAATETDYGGAGIAGALHTGFALVSSVTTIADCTFTDNQAVGGAGGYGGGAQGGAINQESSLTPGNQSILSIVNSVFADNKALGKGVGANAYAGAVDTIDWNTDHGSEALLVVSNSWFVGNAAIASPGGDLINTAGYASGGALGCSASAIIRSSTFLNNRVVGGAWSPAATAGYFTSAYGGGLDIILGTLDVSNSRFVGNQATGGDVSLGGPAGFGVGGGISVQSGLTANLANCSLYNNTAAGGAGSPTISGGDGIGGGLAAGFYPSPANPFPFTGSTVTLTGTKISHNQAIGGSKGGTARGGGYAVGFGVFFGSPDTSTVTLNSGSVVTNNTPDDVFQF